jgi:hypothetical protein
MKRYLIIVVVIILGLLILGAVMWKVFHGVGVEPIDQSPSLPSAPTSATGANSQDPRKFAESFYDWYLLNISRNEAFPYTEDLTVVLKPWLTTDFIANWEELRVTFEVDPILLTTEDPIPWGDKISTKLVSQTDQEAIVSLTIAAGTANMHVYTVTLVTVDGTWKISRVEYAAP